MVLIVAVIFGALIRIYWTWRHGLAIDQEGVEYARIAENLLAHRGYVGIFNNGTQLNFPPLYPLTIAAGTLLLGSSELAARVINVVCGALLVVPMFKIALRLYGDRVAVGVAVLAVVHPVFIAGAASTYAEGPYLTLLMSALLWLFIWIEERRTIASLAAGLFFGLAYLVRPEAFLLVGVFAGCALVAAALSRDRRTILLGTLSLAGTFAVVAAPNVVFLTRSTGQLRIEAKGTMAYAWGSRLNAGMSYEEAANGIGDDLSDQGVFMRPNLEVIRSTKPTLGQYLAYLRKAARHNFETLSTVIADEHPFGSPLLFALMVLGLFRSGWKRERLRLEGTLLLTAGMILLILLTVQELWFRYFYSLLGIFLIWGAKGADEVSEWGRATLASFGAPARLENQVASLLRWGLMAGVVVLALKSMPWLNQYDEGLRTEHVRAGKWIAGQSTGRPWVMGAELQTPFYAGGNLIYLPYANSELALRYVAKRKPDFIVLSSRDRANQLPYASQWFDQGIPDRRAQLVYNEGTPAGEQIKIFRWVDSLP